MLESSTYAPPKADAATPIPRLWRAHGMDFAGLYGTEVIALGADLEEAALSATRLATEAARNQLQQTGFAYGISNWCADVDEKLAARAEVFHAEILHTIEPLGTAGVVMQAPGARQPACFA